MNSSKAIVSSRKAMLVMVSALIVLGGLGWTLAHASDSSCVEVADLEHDQILLVLHSNGAGGGVPRLPSVAR